MSVQDKKFFDNFMIILAILVGISVVIYLISDDLSDGSQKQFISEDNAYQEQIKSRISPVSSLSMPGEAAVAAAVAVAEPVIEELTGAQVYNQACGACHTNGIGGAPKLGDAAAWEPRIAQGLDILRDHAINGYQGNAGYMPAKGGNLGLSDEEVHRSIDYMISESQP
ncbi:MAG: cytochrome c5 family protein [Woeseiaceae bacterium]